MRSFSRGSRLLGSDTIKRLVLFGAITLIGIITLIIQVQLRTSAAGWVNNDLNQYCIKQDSSVCNYNSDKLTNMGSLSGKYTTALNVKYNTFAGQRTYINYPSWNNSNANLVTTAQSMAITNDAFVVAFVPPSAHEDAARNVIAFNISNGSVKWHNYAQRPQTSQFEKKCPEPTSTVTTCTSGIDFGHMNGMTYNSTDDYVLIANGHNRIALKGSTGEFYDDYSVVKDGEKIMSYNDSDGSYTTSTISISGVGIQHNYTLESGSSIAHCAVCKKFILGGASSSDSSRLFQKELHTSSTKSLSSITSYAPLVYTGTNTSPAWATTTSNRQSPLDMSQDIASNDKYFFQVADTWQSGSAQRLLDFNNRFGGVGASMIYQFDINTGNFVHAYYFPNTTPTDNGVAGRDEIESMAFGPDGTPYILVHHIYPQDGDYKPAWYFTIYKITDATVKSQMGATTATIAYDANGGSGAPSSATVATFRSPKISTTKPTKSNSTFTGWNTKADGTGTSVASGGIYDVGEYGALTAGGTLTLYAIWEENIPTPPTPTTITVSYSGNGGINVPDPQTFTAGTPSQLTTDIPSWENHEFLGWTSDPYGTTPEYQPGETVTFTTDVQLFAVWKEATITVTYNANGGTGAPASQQFGVITGGTISSTVPTRDKHTFLGWSTDSTSAEAVYTAGQPGVKFTTDTTLYAVWREETITVTYNANGGSGAPSQQTFGVVSGGKISTTVPTREGYRFLGWSTDQNATEAQYSAGQKNVVFTTNTTLYAVWQLDSEPTVQKTVTYNANGGTGAPAPQTFTTGESFQLSATRPTRENYDFLGWSMMSMATSATYEPGETVTFIDDVTLYAVWQEHGGGDEGGDDQGGDDQGGDDHGSTDPDDQGGITPQPVPKPSGKNPVTVDTIIPTLTTFIGATGLGATIIAAIRKRR